jgi:hypothetical protein
MVALTGAHLPFFFGAWVASTRLGDYWHTNTGVALGSVLGACAAVFSWGYAARPYLAPVWEGEGEELTGGPHQQVSVSVSEPQPGISHQGKGQELELH